MSLSIKRHLYNLLALLLLFAAGTSTVFADNEEFTKSYNFNVRDTGSGTIHLSLLVWAYGGFNHWAAAGKPSQVFIRPEGSTQDIEIFTFWGDNNHNDDTEHGFVGVNVKLGQIAITNCYQSTQPRIVAPKDGSVDQWLDETARKGNKYVQIDWYPPQEYVGKSFKILVRVQDTRSGWTNPDEYNYLCGPFDLSMALPQFNLFTPIFSPSTTNQPAGRIAIPYAISTPPLSYHTSEDPTEIKLGEQAGMIYVSAADTCRYNFFATLQAARSDKDSDGKSLPNWVVQSTAITIPAYHAIHNFHATEYVGSDSIYKGYKRLTWDVHHADAPDIIETDIFEIQRAYNSDLSDAVTIGSVNFASLPKADDDGLERETTIHYEYIDSVPGAYANAINPEREIFYRVVRVSAKAWDADRHDWSRVDSILSPVYLAAPSRLIAHEIRPADDFETSRTVEITVPLDATCVPGRAEILYPIENGVETKTADVIRHLWWDNSAQLILQRHIISNDSVSMEIPILPKNIQFDKRKKIWVATVQDKVDMPCVNYSYTVEIQAANDSPYPLLTEEAQILLNMQKPKGAARVYVKPNAGLGALPNYSPMYIPTDKYNHFYFDEAAKVTNIKATHPKNKNDYNDHVTISWETTAGESDYFIVSRIISTEKGDSTEVINSFCTEHYHEDFDAKGNVEYRYFVTSVLDCGPKGKTEAYSDTIVGMSNNTATIKGKVQYSNGIAFSNVKLTAKNLETGETFPGISDESGSYLILIPNRPEKETQFLVTAEGTFKNKANDQAGYTINVSDNAINSVGMDFFSDDFVRFSGRVLYNTTTVPVSGVQFRVRLISSQDPNGFVVKNTEGAPVVTDSQGMFSLTVPKGKTITIQAFKDGHTFLNDGFVHQGEDGTGDNTLNLTKNTDGPRIWDTTTVRLIGRLVGGNDQAVKPLWTSDSKNNLGDDLQMVFMLEGNDVAHLVYDPKDLSFKERDASIQHYHADQKTNIHYEQKRIIVKPDPVTGEYGVDLLPEKYKITQATAKGYSTLFDKNATAAVIDMTDCLETIYVDSVEQLVPHNATYSLIYHSPVSLTYQQTYYGQKQDFLGEEALPVSDFKNVETMVKTYIEKDGKKEYIFGHPVFNGTAQSTKAKRKYQYILSAHEDYYYNNDPIMGSHDQVQLHGGKVNVSNGFDPTPDSKNAVVVLDSIGQGIATVTAYNPSFTLAGEESVRTVLFSMDVNGLQVYAEPLQGFVTGARHKGTDIIGRNIDVLDVLRDPPGATSYAWLEAGTTYSSTYAIETTFKAGLEIDMKFGASFKNFTGTGALEAFAGTVLESGKTKTLPITFVYSGKTKNTYNYTFTTTERIQTGTGAQYVGNDGNVFIGTEISTMLLRYQSIHLITDSTRTALAGAEKANTLKVLATGVNEKNETVHLVIGDQISISAAPQTSFAYAQRHIVKNLLPELAATRDELILVGSVDSIQALANATGKVLYRSKINDTTSDDFGAPGKYDIIVPKDWKETIPDTISVLNQTIASWQNAIANNERLTLEAFQRNNPVASGANNMAVSAGTSKQWTESASSSYAFNSTLVRPGYAVANNAILFGSNSLKFLASLLAGGDVKRENTVEILKGLYQNKNKDNENNNFASAPNFNFSVSFVPILDVTMTPNGDESKKNTRTVGFKLEEGNHGHINVGVYRIPKRVRTNKDDDTSIEFRGFDANGNKIIDHATDVDDRGLDTDLTDDDYQTANFAFYLNGGATRCPYEDANFTLFYMPGTKLGNRTLKIDDPKIYIDQPIVSNIPADQPAVYDIVLSNESEAPDVDEGLKDLTFQLTVNHETNSNGAKLFIDGVPVSNGISMIIPRGQAVHKKLELYRGTVDDYENIKLTFFTDCQYANRVSTVISAHFLPTSCNVNLSGITDKWVLNTLSPKDSTGYYLPIKIDGFDTQYRNFDHIELQYKKSTQPDESYVSLCNYYADSTLYKAASGNKAMITSGVIDNIYFYGEKDPIEQKYDIRAVSFCRLGSSYVTRSSKVYSGTKDTRLPQVFGSLSPKNGVLGMGDYIGVMFSEDIAGNYLDADNNFQITGYTNGTGIINSTAVVFPGQPNNVASTDVTRNLSEKDFSIDLMMQVKKDVADRDMALFSHGSATENMEFGRTADNRLYLTLSPNHSNEKKTVLSKPIEDPYAWQRVVASYENATGSVRFYADDKEITNISKDKNGTIHTDSLPSGYDGIGRLNFGNSLDGTRPYAGSMLEARLWTRTMDDLTFETTNKTVLTGYERLLLDYYPMNEGIGAHLEDKATGADITMKGQSWSRPAGRSIHFNGTQGIQLDKAYFNRSRLKDYTLGFWFRAEEEQAGDTIALLSEGFGDKVNPGLFIGLRNQQVVVRQKGFEGKAVGNWCDGNWHQLSLTVNRLRNTAYLYLDGHLTTQFAADSLDAIGTNDIWLGECHTTSGELTTKHESKFQLRGNIDDLMFWEMALPENYLNQFYNSVPNGGEMGLLVNLTFSDSETNSSSMYYNAYSGKNHLTKNEQNKNNADATIVLTPEAADMSDNLIIAPVREKDLLSGMRFSWASRENELIVNLDMDDKEINKQNIFISIRDVEDLSGNLLASPVTWTVFVDRNQLKWHEKHVTRSIKYGESDKFSVDIHNLGGTTLNYTIEDLPGWLNTTEERGYVEPTEDATAEFTVKSNLDPGEHTALIYLTDQNGLSEPLLITVNIEAEAPTWKVDRTRYSETMNLIATVKILGNSANNQRTYYDTCEDDIVGAFVDNICLGVQHIGTAQTGLGSVYMTIYGNDSVMSLNKPIEFRLWRAETGRINRIVQEDVNAQPIYFVKDAILGSPSQPVTFVTVSSSIQMLHLDEGWNWISFNIRPDTSHGHFSKIVGGAFEFADGDYIKTRNLYSQYEVVNGYGYWHGELSQLLPSNVYMLKVKNGGQMEVSGSDLDDASRIFYIMPGWNHLPYMCSTINSVQRAMAEYNDKANEGDIIKSYTEFSMWSEREHKWVGTLTDLHPGQGYMIKRNSSDALLFHYTVPQNGDFSDTPFAEARRRHATGNGSGGNMPVVASVVGEDGTGAAEGDVLQAYDGSVLVGEATADSDGRFFLMTAAENGAQLSFRLVRSADYEASASSAPLLAFDDATSVGTLRDPFVIDLRNSKAGAYPNPFREAVTFSALTSVGDHVSIRVFDAAGAVVFSHEDTAQSDRYTLTTNDLANLAKGIYVAHVNVGGRNTTVKLIHN